MAIRLTGAPKQERGVMRREEVFIVFFFQTIEKGGYKKNGSIVGQSGFFSLY